MTLDLHCTMSKQEYDSITEDEKQMIVMELGYATLGLIYAMNQCRHSTLNGHLYYQNADRESPESVRGQFVKWLRWLSAYGPEAKEKNGYPSWLVGFSIWHIGGKFLS